MTDEQAAQISAEIGWVKDELVKIEHRMMELIFAVLMLSAKELTDDDLKECRTRVNLFYKNNVRV